MSVYRTMSPREEADWLRAVEDGSLWPHHQPHLLGGFGVLVVGEERAVLHGA